MRAGKLKETVTEDWLQLCGLCLRDGDHSNPATALRAIVATHPALVMIRSELGIALQGVTYDDSV